MSRFPVEPDDDEDRQRRAELKLHTITVQRLLTLKNGMTRDERALLADLDFRVCVCREIPSEPHLRKLKDIAWKYRRQMPVHLAPKLPPHDPIVAEMEKRR